MELVDALAPVAASDADVEVAALFGSAARGRLGPESDVDVYVRLRVGARWDDERRERFTRSLERIARREIDLVIEDRDATSTLLRLEVSRHGRLIHERVPGAWTSLRADAMVAYADMEPFMRRTGEGIRRRIRSRVGG